MTLALTADGLQTQTQQELVEQITAKLRSTFGNNTNTTTSSILGQLTNIEAEFLALNQDVLKAVWRSFDPNSAIGVALDRLANLTGTTRKGATNSTVEGLYNFNAAGTVSNGDLFNNVDTNQQWEAIGGPYVAVGAGSIAGSMAAVATGPLIANAGTNWAKVTANPNLDDFTNVGDDANPGRNEETDPDLRVRRQTELYARNIGGLLAISGVVSKVDGVLTATTYHNPATPGLDADGIPFKAFNVVVETNPSVPGAALQQSIGDAIFSAMGAGGEAYGTDYTTTVTDVEGVAHTDIRFDLVGSVDVYAAVTITTAGTEQAVSSNMKEVTEAALLEFANANFKDIGRNQLGFEWVGVVSDLQEAGEISGAVTVTVQLSRTAIGGPFADPLEIDIRERPDFDSANIVVTVV